MKVFLLKDVERIGCSGEIIKVSDGYAANFLIPRKLAVEVTPLNEKNFVHRVKVVEKRHEVIQTKTSLLAEKIKSLKLTYITKSHDGDKLYGAVSAADVVDLLAKENISVSKSQIIFEKSIKTKGSHPVTVKLSTTLQPTFILKVVGQ